jgi:hypothetical protein
MLNRVIVKMLDAKSIPLMSRIAVDRPIAPIST